MKRAWRTRSRRRRSTEMKRAVTLVMLWPPTPAREPAAWKHAPSQPSDAITAFAVPNPNWSSQSQSDFSGLVAQQVALPSGSLNLLRTGQFYLNQSFRSSTLRTLNGLSLVVNAAFRCNVQPDQCAQLELQFIEWLILAECEEHIVMFSTKIPQRGGKPRVAFAKEPDKYLDLRNILRHVCPDRSGC